MSRVADAFWRAAAYCLHPRVIGLSLLPLVVSAALAFGLGYFFWEAAVAGVRATMESWSLVDALLKWLDSLGAASFRTVLAPIVVLAMAVPALVVLSLLLVALLMTPSMVDLVAQRRFAGLERKRGAGFVASLSWSLGHTVLCVVLLVASLPFWLIPPLALILPPLIWGWLGYRVFTFDVLAEHASGPERRRLLNEHRLPLLLLGLATGYLGAAPAAIWAMGALTIAFAPVLILVSVWLYTLVFAFSSLWFAHYALAALQDMRRADTVAERAPDPVMDALPANYATQPPSLADDPDPAPPAIENKPSPL
ncbi:EI24 domain-containing protein [Mitsuaria sp. GD03876]|nr:EI24 domain-containing protein [Mitsuaria sp. GD03876]MDH0864340.1 EI24 domain-containing protein [Mitsuaria sp. GD03876]